MYRFANRHNSFTIVELQKTCVTTYLTSPVCLNAELTPLHQVVQTSLKKCANLDKACDI